MAAPLYLVPKKECARKSVIDSAMDALDEDFAVNLAIAREFWRRFPDLVTAADFPEPFCAAYRKIHGDVPGPEDATFIDPRCPVARAALRAELEG